MIAGVCESAYDPHVVKIEKSESQWRHKLDRIGVRRIRMFPLLRTAKAERINQSQDPE